MWNSHGAQNQKYTCMKKIQNKIDLIYLNNIYLYMKSNTKSIFVKKLYVFINTEDSEIFRSVKWDKQKDKLGFSIIDNYTFHKKCLKNNITKSNNYKSLYRQLNNYGFKYSHGFWHHYKNYFFKNSKFLNKIKYKEYLKYKSIQRPVKKIEMEFLHHYKDNNTILDATKKFICNELFNSIEFDISHKY